MYSVYLTDFADMRPKIIKLGGLEVTIVTLPDIKKYDYSLF